MCGKPPWSWRPDWAVGGYHPSGTVAPMYAFAGGGARWQQAGALMSALDGPKTRVALALGLAALALILLRSGNEAPIGVAQMELMFRERLEDLLSVRPRTKEIVGLPALFFFLAYFHNRKPPSIVLVLLGSVCHLHTPIAISLIRALLGALLGVVMGSIAYGLYAAYLAAVRKLKH